MPVYTTYALGESQISVSGGEQLSGITQGDGSHLVGETITLDSNAWEAVDIDDSESDFDDSDTGQSLDGAQTFDGTSYADGAVVEAEYELTLQDPDGNTYTVLGFNINEGGGGSAYGTVEGLAFVGGVGGFPPIGVPLTVITATEGPSRGYSSLASPPCFVAGSLIEIPGGAVPVETLAPGDLVVTLDHGPQAVRWIGRARVPAAVMARDHRFRPVRIRRDAFAPGCPARDMHLSQQHRILIADWRAELFFGESEIMVPAKKLANDTSILIDHDSGDLCYVHLLFDRHEIIWADGLACESYFPDPAAHTDCATRQEVLRLFPQIEAGLAGGRTARACIHDRRALMLGAAA